MTHGHYVRMYAGSRNIEQKVWCSCSYLVRGARRPASSAHPRLRHAHQRSLAHVRRRFASRRDTHGLLFARSKAVLRCCDTRGLSALAVLRRGESLLYRGRHPTAKWRPCCRARALSPTWHRTCAQHVPPQQRRNEPQTGHLTQAAQLPPGRDRRPPTAPPRPCCAPTTSLPADIPLVALCSLLGDKILERGAQDNFSALRLRVAGRSLERRRLRAG